MSTDEVKNLECEVADPMSISRKQNEIEEEEEEEENSMSQQMKSEKDEEVEVEGEVGEEEKEEKESEKKEGKNSNNNKLNSQLLLDAMHKAPPSDFVSSWPIDQLEATQRLHESIHGYSCQKLGPQLKVILMRIQDRLAHYLISHVCYGEDSEWSRKAEFIWEKSRPEWPDWEDDETEEGADSSGDAEFDFSNDIKRYRLRRIAFPLDIEQASKQLLMHARYSLNGIDTKLDSFSGIDAKKWKEPKILQPDDYENVSDEECLRVETHGDSTVFTEKCAKRWIQDFKKGQERKEQSKMTDCNVDSSTVPATGTPDAASSSPASAAVSASTLLVDPLFSVYLRIFIEYISAEIIEVSCHYDEDSYKLSDKFTQYMNTIDLWRRCWTDDGEIRALINFLGIDWRVNAIGSINVNRDDEYQSWDHQRQLWEKVKDDTGESGSHQKFPTLIQLLSTEFATYKPAADGDMSEEKIDAPSTIAHSVIESVATRSLRCYNNMRAYRHWGTHPTLINGNKEFETAMDDYFEEELVDFPKVFKSHFFNYTSFTIDDADGREWHFMFEYKNTLKPKEESNPLFYGFIIELDRGVTIGSFVLDEEKRLCITIQKTPVQYASNGMKMEYQPRTLTQLKEIVSNSTAGVTGTGVSVTSSSSSACPSSSSSSSSSSVLFDPLLTIDFMSGVTHIYTRTSAIGEGRFKCKLKFSSPALLDLAQLSENTVATELSFIIPRAFYLCQEESKIDARVYMAPHQ